MKSFTFYTFQCYSNKSKITCIDRSLPIQESSVEQDARVWGVFYSGQWFRHFVWCLEIQWLPGSVWEKANVWSHQILGRAGDMCPLRRSPEGGQECWDVPGVPGLGLPLLYLWRRYVLCSFCNMKFDIKWWGSFKKKRSQPAIIGQLQKRCHTCEIVNYNSNIIEICYYFVCLSGWS